MQTPLHIQWHTNQCALMSIDVNETMIVTAGTDRLVRIWDRMTFELLTELNEHQKIVNLVRFILSSSFSSSRLITAGDDSTIILWINQKKQRKKWTRIQTLRSLRQGEIYDFHYFSSRLVVASLHQPTLLYLFSPEEEEKKEQIPSHCYIETDSVKEGGGGKIQGVAIDPQLKYIALQSSLRWVKIYSLSLPRTLITTLSPGFVKDIHLFTFIRRLAWSNDGEWLFLPSGSLNEKKDDEEEDDGDDEEDDNNKVGKEEEFGVTWIYQRNQWNKPFGYQSHLCHSIAIRVSPIIYSPYIHILAILTQETILVIGLTKEGKVGQKPLFYEQGMHQQLLTDVSWSIDGSQLFMTSLDGYISILTMPWKEGGFIPLIK